MILLWVLLGAMTLLAILLVIWPLWRLSKLPSHPSATASQVDFFRSQQQQLIEEHRQDGLNIKDYQLARAELVSSLLDTVPTPEISHSFRPSYKLTLLVVIVLPLMAISWYLQMGASDALRQQWSATQQANLAQEAMAQYGSMANLTAALLAKVKQQPNDARGWYLLAKLYVSQEQYSQALTAYQRANQLQPGQKDIIIGYVTTSYSLHHQLTSTANKMLQQILVKNPADPEANHLLAVAAYDRGDYPTASQIWQRMLKQFPPESNEAKALQIMLATVQQKE